MPATKEEAAVLPAKEPYRVSALGATYFDPVIGLRPDGSEGVISVDRIGRFGETIELTAGQAARLVDLGVVKPAGEERSYDEMTVDELKALADERALDVKGSGANGAALKDDYVNALNTFDQGQAGAAGAGPG
jgi:hypothetical protein